MQSRIGVDRALKTFKLRTYQLSLLREYVRKRYKLKDITLNQLDKAFIEGFEYYLSIDLGLKPSTIAGTLSTLQSIVLQAVRRGYLDLNPFMGYSYDRPKGEPRSITRAELQALIALEIAWENYRIMRDLFVFSCFTGLAISDVRNLREEQLVTEEGELWIKGRRQKTKSPYRVQVLPPALTMIERYRGKRAGFVFDVPSVDVVLNGMHYRRKQLQMDRPLTFHTARHTFATTICLENGLPIETVSKMLGHSFISTTELYAKVSKQKNRQGDVTTDGERADADASPSSEGLPTTQASHSQRSRAVHRLRSSSYRAKVQGCPFAIKVKSSGGENFCTYESLSEYEQKNIFVRTEIYRLAEEKFFSSASREIFFRKKI